MLIDEIIINCDEEFVKGLVKFIKEKNEYVFYNLTSSIGYYTITLNTCNKISQIETGTIGIDPIRFKAVEDGEYTVIFTIGEDKEKVILSHYPSIIKAVVRDIKLILCTDCGCNTNPCLTTEANNCIKYQNIFGNLSLLLGIYKTIEKCNSKEIIRDFISKSTEYYKCDLFSHFCSKELNLKVEGKSSLSGDMFKKIIALQYLGLYFYERLINSPLEENVKYLNNLFCYKTIKPCITKAGVDLTDMETLFSMITYCETDIPEECSVGCLIPINNPTIHTFTYWVGEQVQGIKHITSLRNNCPDEDSYIDRVIYRDNEFKVQALNTQGINPLFLLSGEIANINIVFTGTKSVPTLIKIPFKYKRVLIDTYHIEFKIKEEPNRPPIISQIIKELENRLPYVFTVQDFEDHFVDPDGDALLKIEIVGDTSRFKLNGVPYISGTAITKNNITSLVYLPLDTDDDYNILLNWRAYDEHGLESN